jgi:hypothetical protein
MQTHLTRTVRDNAGHIHNRGEHVTVLGHWLELGTHRDLLRARWDSGVTVILLPEDVEEDSHNGTHITTFGSPDR